MKETVTIANMEVTPDCQRAHGGLAESLMEAMRRAIVPCELADEAECNRDACYEVVVKLRRNEAVVDSMTTDS